MQKGVRSVLNPTLSWWFWINDQQLWYRWLAVNVFMDTMFMKVKSRCQNTCAQVFMMANGFTQAYPMASKSQVHEALSLFHQREGVPNVMVMDGSKEQLLGKFHDKCWQAGLHIKQTEPYTLGSNAVEGATCELKWGVGCEKIQSRAPKQLWDAWVSQARGTHTIGNGLWNSWHLCHCDIFCWYEWLMFRDMSIPFPEDNMVLGHNLGPAIDNGPAMAKKILKENG